MSSLFNRMLSSAITRTALGLVLLSASSASFAVEKFSVDGLRGLTPERIQQRFDELSELVRFDKVAL